MTTGARFDALPLRPDSLPAALRQLRWAVWKAEPRSGGGFNKAPRDPASGRKIATNQPEQWTTFAAALAAASTGAWDGIGLLLTPESGIIGVDIDDAKGTLAANPALRTVCEQYVAAGGYMERSPSGKGLRGFVRATLPAAARRRAGKIEIYDRARFLTVTGHGQGDILADQAFVDTYCCSMGNPPASGTTLGLEPLANRTAPEAVALHAIISEVSIAEPDLWAGNWAASGRFPSQSEADQALANKLAGAACRAAVVPSARFATIEQAFSQSGLGQREKWTSRSDYRERTIGKALSTALGPTDAGVPDHSDNAPNVLQQFVDRYFVAPSGKKTWVFDRSARDIMASALSVSAFRELHANRFHAGNPVVGAFMKSPRRLTYPGGITFDPRGGESADQFNLWRGLAIRPKRGPCRRILRHVREVLCGGDSQQFKYLLRWMALLVQQPWVKPEVAIVLRSLEGTGKSLIAGMLADFFGLHGFTASQSSQVVGQFNGHLYDKVIVVLEEAFFAGDPRAESQAKVLVTNPVMAFEWKFMGAESRPSYHHVWILTNRDWAVPAGADARRYAVLDVSPYRKGDYPYFSALAEEIAGDGSAAFLHFLLRIKLSAFNPRRLPKTAALARQKAETLRQTCPEQGWWLDALIAGEVTLADGGSVPFAQPVRSDELQAAYEHHIKGLRYAKRWPRAIQDLRKVMPAGGLVKRRLGGGGIRYHEYVLPDLADARKAFTDITGAQFDD